MTTHTTVRIAACAFALLAVGACTGRAVMGPRVISYAPPPLIQQDDAELSLLTFQIQEFSPEDIMVAENVPIAPPLRCDIVAIVASTPTDILLASASIGIQPRIRGARNDGDFNKDIALRMLDTETCTTQIITVRQTYEKQVVDGISRTVPVLRAPAGWDIAVVRRVNGVHWNYWESQLRVTAPANRIVVGVKYPRVAVKEKGRFTPVIVVPYSDELASAQLAARGWVYATAIHQAAMDDLRAREVPSRALTDTLVADVAVLTPEASTRRMLNEHMDPKEFTLDSSWTMQRALVRIGANGDFFALRTCSPAKACGPRQFTPGTYQDMVRAFPEAKLIKDFTAGTQNALNIAKAQVLLDDYNLARLIGAFGADIVTDPQLQEYLTAAYNTGVGRVIAVVSVGRQKNVPDWIDAKGKRCSRANRYAQCLLDETKMYIMKERFLVTQTPPDRSVAATF